MASQADRGRFSVAGQAVLVSGASRGIGYAIAAGFVDAGASVVITGRDGATLAEAARRLAAGGGTARAVVCDVSDPAAVERAVAGALAATGHIDTLVNCAGVNRRQPAETFTPEDYDLILDINLRGAFLVSQAVGRHMIGRGSGNQINIDSVNSHTPLARVAPYAMSKAGMNMMTRALAYEWGPHGVRVNGVAPGAILTDLTRKVWDRPEMQAWMLEATPLQRLGTPEDIVGATLFLASPAAAYVTGHTIRVDGGLPAGINWPIG